MKVKLTYFTIGGSYVGEASYITDNQTLPDIKDELKRRHRMSDLPVIGGGVHVMAETEDGQKFLSVLR